MRRIDAIVETLYSTKGRNDELRANQATFKQNTSFVAYVGPDGGLRFVSNRLLPENLAAFRDWVNTLLGED